MHKAKKAGVLTLAIGIVLTLLGSSALAAPTVSGRLESYDSSTRTLVLVRQDGSRKAVQLVKGAKVEWMGRNTVPTAINKGNQVALRICGALNDDPLQADLLCDWSSSSKYVATSAKAPYYTQVGAYATANGAGGPSDALPNVPNPMTTVGVLGNGGKLQASPQMVPTDGAAANPMATPTSTMPINQGSKMSMPMNMMSNPMMTTPGMMGADPSMMGMNPMMADPSMMGMNPMMADPSMMGMNPMMGDPSMMGMNPAMTGYDPSMAAAGHGMMAGSDEDSPDAGVIGAGGYAGLGQISLQGQVVQADPVSRTLLVQAYGSPAPQTVIITPTAQVQMQLLRPGTMVNVSGIATGGAIQAFSVTHAGP